MSGSSPEALRLYQKALTLHSAGQIEPAIACLEKAITLDARLDDAYEALSVILYNQSRYDDAIKILKHWICSNADSIMARTNLSRCYVAKGMIAEAEHEQAESRRLTWKAELKSKKQAAPAVDLSSQVEKYRKIIAFDPQDVLGYFSLGSVYLDALKYREAMDIFEQAVAVAPDHTASYLGLGQALEGLGDTEKAKRIYREGIRVGMEKGDMMPQKKMESRLKALEEKKA